MAGHTPGPWSIDIGNGAIYAKRGASFDCESELVERVATMRPTCVTDRWEADARLIAAAPELLYALKASSSLENLGYNIRHTDETDGPDESGVTNKEYRAAAERLHDLIRAAIAKAEGR